MRVITSAALPVGTRKRRNGTRRNATLLASRFNKASARSLAVPAASLAQPGALLSPVTAGPALSDGGGAPLTPPAAAARAPRAPGPGFCRLLVGWRRRQGLYTLTRSQASDSECVTPYTSPG